MLEQDLNAFNDINTLQLEIYDVGVDVGYSLSSNFLTKLYGKLYCRNGYENIYENLSFNKYRLTTVYNNYKSKHFELTNSYLFLFNKKEQNIQFEVSYNKIKQEYRSTHMFQKISSLDVTISYGINKNNFSTNIYMGYSKNLESDIRLADDVLTPKVKEEALLPNYLYLSSDKIHAGLNASYQYRISSDKSLFFRGDCKLEHIKNRELSKNLVFTTGLTF